jgi:carbon-monoxide dehydrogenase small subunit
MMIEFTLNGQSVKVEAPASSTLLHVLRECLSLTGSKPGCEVGECGACSVILDGRVVNSCQLVAPQVQGREVITIEGIGAPDGGPNDLQLAFLEFGAVQCGYCTPGMVIAAEAFLVRHPNPTRAEIREAISGNLCRCTGYQQIVDAIEATAARRRSGAQGRGG